MVAPGPMTPMASGMMPAPMMPPVAVPAVPAMSASSPAHVVDLNRVQITGSDRRRIGLIRERGVQFGWLSGHPTCNGYEGSKEAGKKGATVHSVPLLQPRLP